MSLARTIAVLECHLRLDAIEQRFDVGKRCGAKNKPCGDACIPRKRNCHKATSETATQHNQKARAKEVDRLKQERDRRREVRRTAKEQTLEDLFLNADRIGNKYQTIEERDTNSRKLAQVVGEIGDLVDQRFPDENDVVSFGKKQPKLMTPAQQKATQKKLKGYLPGSVSKMMKPKKFDSDELEHLDVGAKCGPRSKPCGQRCIPRRTKKGKPTQCNKATSQAAIKPSKGKKKK